MEAEEADLKLLASRNDLVSEEKIVTSALQKLQQAYHETLRDQEVAQQHIIEAERARREAEKREALLRDRQRQLSEYLRNTGVQMQHAKERVEAVKRRRTAMDGALEEALQRRDNLRADEGKLYQKWFEASMASAALVDDVLAAVSRDQRAAENGSPNLPTEDHKEAEEAGRTADNANQEGNQRDTRATDAFEAETTRCVQRDLAKWPRRSWSPLKALERYYLVSDEFDNTKFDLDHPVTFWSIPWPTLYFPADMNWDKVELQIEWGSVEAFFTSMKLLLTGPEYKTLVEKTHRRFHPDKWRSRGLLATIPATYNRASLEAAGNRVVQAVTPLRS